MNETEPWDSEMPAGLDGEVPANVTGRSRNPCGPEADTATETAISLNRSGSRRWGTVISLIALAFSGISLYETVLKQARPAIYISDKMLFGRIGLAGEYSDAIVLPVTIANHGSRDTVVTKLRLAVRRQGTADARTMSSQYSGDTPRAQRLFTPIPIAGHNSSAGGVVFTPADDRGSIFKKGAYEFCLSIQAETSDYPGLSRWLPAFQPASLRFQSVFPDLAEGQLIEGGVLTLKAENAEYSTPSCNPP
jgi:hypothetical protein